VGRTEAEFSRKFPGGFRTAEAIAGTVRGMTPGIARRPRRTVSPAGAAQSAPTLPAWKAFAVQFSTETCPVTGVFSGRVEHLNSGRRARFASKADLLAVLERMLADIEESTR
jgi:hypothetical protein